MLSGIVKLGGRQFACVNYEHITVRNEHYVMRLMRATGLDLVLPGPEESDGAYQARLYARLVDTEQLPELLSGYLLPTGKTEADWSRELAAETAAFIGGLTRPEDKHEVHRLGLAISFDFFRAGLDSLRASQSLLERLTPSGPGPTASNPSPSAAPSTPASGPPSFARSLATTMRRRWRSLGGRSANS